MEMYFNLNFLFLGPKSMLKPEGESASQDKYDNYLTKLQNICTEPVGGMGVDESNKPVYESMKSAIQNMSALPAQT